MTLNDFMRILPICFIVLLCSGCNKNFIKNGTYVGVDVDDCYITIKDEMVTLDRPYFADDTNEYYQLFVYMDRYMDLSENGYIPTPEDEENLKKDLPDFNPNDYIGKTYRLDFMNEETYVKGEVYDIMLWDNDVPVEILSGEYDPETGILNIGGTDYKLGKIHK